MLRAENEATIVPLQRTLRTMFGSRRYGLQLGKQLVATG